jgi:hypothetical protein
MQDFPVPVTISWLEERDNITFFQHRQEELELFGGQWENMLTSYIKLAKSYFT